MFSLFLFSLLSFEILVFNFGVVCVPVWKLKVNPPKGSKLSWCVWCRQANLCIFQAERCRRRSWGRRRRLAGPPSFSRPADWPAAGSLTGRRRTLEGLAERVRRMVAAALTLWIKSLVTEAEDLPGHGRHELAEEQVSERSVHQGHIQGLRLQGQTSSHLRFRERHLDRETTSAGEFVFLAERAIKNAIILWWTK